MRIDYSGPPTRQAGTAASPENTLVSTIRPVSTRTYGSFDTWLVTGTFLGVQDPVLFHGYNYAAGGGAGDVATDPSYVWGMEAHWLAELGRPIIETYLEWKPPGGTTASGVGFVRPFYPLFEKYTGESTQSEMLGYGPSTRIVRDVANTTLVYIRAAGAKVIGGAPSIATIAANDTVQLVIDGLSRTITFQAGDNASWDAVLSRINTAFPIAKATVQSGVLTLISHSPTGSVQVVGGTAVAKLGLTVGTTTATPARAYLYYAPAVSTDWTGTSPPAASDTAADQLASRLTLVERAMVEHQLDDCLIVLVSDFGVTLTSNVVSSFADPRQGIAISATQATAGKRPSIVTGGGPNGRACMRFSQAGGTYLKTPDLSVTQPVFMVAVSRYRVASSGGCIFDGTNLNTGLIYNTAEAQHNFMYAGALGPNTYLADQTQWTVWGAYFNGASSYLDVNGTTVSSVAGGAGNPGAGAMGGLTIGAFANGTTPGEIDLAAILMFVGTPTVKQKRQIYSLLRRYYNLSF